MARRAPAGVLVGMGLAALPGCAPVGEGDESVGQVSQAVSNLGAEHDLVLNEFPTRNVSTTWLPTLDVHGPILAAYTVGGPENPGAWYAYTEDIGVPDPLNWQPGGPGGYIGAQFRWDDIAHPWPEPENFCELYSCSGQSVDTFIEYSASVKALSTDHLGVATIVAIARTDDSGEDAYDIVVLSSLDNGATFTNARIVSTGVSGGSELEWLDRVDATTIVATEEGTERDRDSTAAHIVVWFGGPQGEEKWWVTKVLVDPTTGRVAVLNEPLELGIFDVGATGTSRVTVRAYEDGEGLENIAFFSSRRRTDEGEPYGPYDPLPTCPTSTRLSVEWYYNRAVGLFDHNPSVGPNWQANNILIDDDPAWKPCVGPGNDLYANGERGDMDFNRDPWLAKFAYAKTEPESDMVRVYMVERGLMGLGYVGSPSPSGTTRTQILKAGEEDEDYNPKIEMGQGTDYETSGRSNPRFALVRKRVDANGDIAIIGRTEDWFMHWDLPINPGYYTTDEVVDEAVVSAPVPPSVTEGTTLGLTYQPICFSDDYGTCSTAQPERLFHTLYPRSRYDTIVGRAFED